jgi:NADPH-dependent curcumin reductase CurA
MLRRTTSSSKPAILSSDGGWQYFVEPAKRLQKRVRREPLSHLMSVLALRQNRVADCSTSASTTRCLVVVSAAAGATGSIAAQIANQGARVIGIAGNADAVGSSTNGTRCDRSRATSYTRSRPRADARRLFR